MMSGRSTIPPRSPKIPHPPILKSPDRPTDRPTDGPTDQRTMAYKQTTNNTPNIGPLQIFNQGENLKYGFRQLYYCARVPMIGRTVIWVHSRPTRCQCQYYPPVYRDMDSSTKDRILVASLVLNGIFLGMAIIFLLRLLKRKVSTIIVQFHIWRESKKKFPSRSYTQCTQRTQNVHIKIVHTVHIAHCQQWVMFCTMHTAHRMWSSAKHLTVSIQCINWCSTL